MRENHMMIPLEEGENSIGYFSYAPPKNLIVFVHGFKGASEDTWGDFKHYIKNYTAYKESDIIFYGYPSLHAGASSHAAVFYSDIKNYICPPKQIFSMSRISAANKYEKIIFVAHSLGAIVARRALLFAMNDECSWLQQTNLIVMAPAHNGTYVPKIAFEALDKITKIVAPVAKFLIPVLNDLQYDSPAIKNLIADTEKALKQSNCNYLKADVIWAYKDKVVINERFGEDRTPEVVKDKTHISVCKPIHVTYTKPYDFVTKKL